MISNSWNEVKVYGLFLYLLLKYMFYLKPTEICVYNFNVTINNRPIHKKTRKKREKKQDCKLDLGKLYRFTLVYKLFILKK